jgi:hypothetical protein
MISHIIYNVKPRIYQTTLSIVKRELHGAHPLSLDVLKKDLREVYSQFQTGSHRSERKETVLVAQGGNKKFTKRFKGDCRICGKKGHKAGECWDNEKNKDKRPTSRSSAHVAALSTEVNALKKKTFCTYCKKDNHNIDRCFKKQKDDKRKGLPGDYTDVMVLCTEMASSPCDSSDNIMIGIDGLKFSTTDKLFEFEDDMMAGATHTEIHKQRDKTGSRWNRSYGRNAWILDSGSTSHMRFSLDGMSELVPWKSEITVGNKEIIYSEQKGTFRGQVISPEGGVECYVTLKDVLYVPGVFMNLFSLTKAFENESIRIDRVGYAMALIMNNNERLMFNQVIQGRNGHLLAADIHPRMHTTENLQLPSTSLLSYESFHHKLGHANETVVKATARKMGLKLDLREEICEHCAKAKSKRKKISKINMSNLATYKGQRIMFDISSVNTYSQGGNKFWLLVMDEFTKMKWSFFLKRKSDLVNTMMHFSQDALKIGIKIEYFRCDNSGENMAFKKRHDASTFKAIFEFTAPYTPEQNGTVERAFPTLFGKTRAMLNAAGLPKWLRDRLWAMGGRLTTLLDNIVVTHHEDESPYEKWHNDLPRWMKFLRTFGEMGIVQDGKRSKIKAKLDDRGFPAMFVGYPTNHSPDVYQMYNCKTKGLLLSRNVVWLGKSYGEFHRLTPDQIHHVTVTDYSSDEESDDASADHPIMVEEHNHIEREELPAQEAEEPIEVEENEPRVRTRVSGLGRDIQNLTTFYNPDPISHLPDEDENDDYGLVAQTTGLHEVMREVAFAATGAPGFDPFPKNYHEAMLRDDRMKWKEAMWKEFKDIEDKEVWMFIKKSKVPHGRKLIGNRWVFNIKDDGRYRARTVAKGYSQIPGKDFQENHAPVIHDTSFHLALVQKIIYKLSSRQFDIETAFLYGELDEEIYMVFPDGYEDYLANEQGCNFNAKEHCVLLKKALYGLVQAARQWWKKITEVLSQVGFLPSPADPCLFVKKQNKDDPPAFVILYVDDGGIIGTSKIIDQVIQCMAKTFTVKDLGPMEHFVGCHLLENKSRNTMWIHQPKLIRHLEESFMHLMQDTRSYRTPGAPKTVVLRPISTDELISAKDQSLYRSGVGMLLYLIKHSRPDLSNAVRELTKVLDGATPAHMKAMLRVIRFVFETKNYALRLKPNIVDGKLLLKGISDSEFAGDRNIRKSVYGYIIYYCGAPISWKSKAGQSVTLSSTEAEYYAASETAKELVFVANLLKSMNVSFETPVSLLMDNTGAIYLANNFTTGQRSKHIDIRAHFVRELIVSGMLRTIFVKSEDNDGDIMTKNVSEELFIKHTDKLMDNM